MHNNTNIITTPMLGEGQDAFYKRVLPILGVICRTMAGFAPVSQQIVEMESEQEKARKQARRQRVEQRLAREEEARQARKLAHIAEVSGGHVKGQNPQPNKYGKGKK